MKLTSSSGIWSVCRFLCTVVACFVGRYGYIQLIESLFPSLLHWGEVDLEVVVVVVMVVLQVMVAVVAYSLHDGP